MKDHFQNTDIVEFELKDGSKFGYKPMTAGEEIDYADEYIVVKKELDENGNMRKRRVEDPIKINKVRLYNLVKAPYDNWENLNKEQRWNILRNLKPSIFNEILNNVMNIVSGGDLKKKLSKQ